MGGTITLYLVIGLILTTEDVMSDSMNDKQIAYCLMVGCPHGKRLYACPFKKYEKLENYEKYKASENLSDEDAEKMVHFHHRRSMAREGMKKIGLDKLIERGGNTLN